MNLQDELYKAGLISGKTNEAFISNEDDPEKSNEVTTTANVPTSTQGFEVGADEEEDEKEEGVLSEEQQIAYENLGKAYEMIGEAAKLLGLGELYCPKCKVGDERAAREYDSDLGNVQVDRGATPPQPES